ncbi:plastocyanin/azurin family copper-binding protein [Paenibacillus sp.]|uniref:plastocyanin/azurin family copper-binding protein n=1 Tax=Paenibacillus sp. TaxID=58172 RepID=UPI002D2C1F87|nr:plastocyanin/azurin family copper-binding protein [Paenibacillus sp.]HZG56637.1 plastocyanin/azurin family copper-binding protein [Paenibacillus sp.]
MRRLGIRRAGVRSNAIATAAAAALLLATVGFGGAGGALAAEEGAADRGPGAIGGGASVISDADVAAELGLLLGDGNGVTAPYLAKPSTRLQAAILSLRLTGRLQEAMRYEPKTNFSDKDLVSPANQAILGFLKEHPELGWQGPGDGRFDPLAAISSQQFYKVMLEALGYRSGTDFEYADTESFAASKGLSGIRGTASLTNAHLATALVESLGASSTAGPTLLVQLQTEGVVSTETMLPAGARIGLASDPELGTLLTDDEGRTLYFFTRDAADPNACQAGCLQNWPIYYEESIVVPAMLDKADFGAATRSDGAKQLTYKGWPLYTFGKDASAGDVNGEGVNGVWFAAKPDYAVMIGTSLEHGHYLTDDYGNALYRFAKDSADASACAGSCITNWPPYAADGKAVPSTLAASDFGSIVHPEGGAMTTFKKAPLYYFAKDAARGDVLGHKANDLWFLVAPDAFEGAGAKQAKTYHVDMKDYSFGSGPLTVEAGSTIVFTNYDDMEHNAVAVDGSFKTPLLKKGETYSITLDRAGTYEYFCEPHKRFMTGTIIVE